MSASNVIFLMKPPEVDAGSRPRQLHQFCNVPFVWRCKLACVAGTLLDHEVEC